MSHKVRAKNMKKKRTRLQKERAKIRKLQRENANLKVDKPSITGEGKQRDSRYYRKHTWKKE